MELLPGEGSNEIELCLHDADWNSPPEYEAISYTWGDPKNVIQCKCEGRKLVITKSLHEALLQFRFIDQSRYLWADAVW